MKKVLLILGLSLASHMSFGGDLIVDAKINRVGSVNNNADVFFITFVDGSGVCAGQTIDFPAGVAQSPAAHARSFSLAMAAYTTGKKIRVYSYQGNDCKQANFISMYD